jgi:dolichyl-phosphate beta-glucosyltransferase
MSEVRRVSNSGRCKQGSGSRFLQNKAILSAMSAVCLVIPCFNERNRLPQGPILDAVQRRAGLSICFVDDGSTDGTIDVLEALQANAPAHIDIIRLERNSGKAEAVRQGILHITRSNEFAIVGYWDADLATPLDDLDDLMSALAGRSGCLLAMGSRVRRLGSSIDRHRWRHITGRIFATCASVILRLPVYDSQCGSKIFRRDAAAILFRDPFLTQWLFDVEILARMRARLGAAGVLHSVVEVPLRRWVDVGKSKLRFTHLLGVPLDLLKIHLHYNGRPSVSRSETESTAALPKHLPEAPLR